MGFTTCPSNLEDGAGNVSTINVDLGIVGARDVEIDSLDPNLPFLDLLEADDTGHHNDDNVTNITLLRNPDFAMTSEDRTSNPSDYAHLIAQNLKFRVFDRSEANTEVLIYDSATDATIPGKVDGLTELQLLQKRLSQVLNNPNGLALADGIHNFKLEVEDRAGNISPDFLLNVTIDTAVPAASIDLIDSSDSGIDNQDNITNINAPAFAGISEVGATVRIYANGQLVGVEDVQADGDWEVTVEPLTDGAYDMTVEIEDWAGNIGTAGPLTIQIDTLAPQRPTLDLPTTSDSGMSDVDNITGAADPVPFTVTVDEGENVTTPFDPLTVVIKDGNNVIDTFTSTGGATTRTLALAEGTHLLSVETIDDAGNRSHQSEELVVVIDRAAPADPAAADLLSVADSGTSNRDNLTNKMQPAFSGTVEPNAKVRLLADGEIVGQTVANSDGSWEITSEPLVDGPHNMTLVVEDLPATSTTIK